jgi:murein DD-endopeptidase MepM/ murein hydrolase activator NlpD
VIGKVGNTGNAAKTPSHLHYSIASIFPQGDWRWEPQQVIFYINPIKEMK